MACLILRTDARGQGVFPLTRAITTLGRHSENDIVLEDNRVSRRHARIDARGDAFVLADVGSRFGSFVNDRRAEPELPLCEGDRIRLGLTEMLFSLADEAELEFEPVAAPPIGPETLSAEPVAQAIPSGLQAGSADLPEEHATVLSRIAEATQSLLDLDPLLGVLMDLLMEVFRPDRGVIFLRDGKEGELAPQVSRPEGAALEVSHTVLDHAVDQRKALLLADLQGDSRFSGAESIVAQSILSAICCPLVRQEKVLGVIYIDAQSRKLIYGKEELALLNIIAANAAISVENAILVRDKVRAERLAAVGVAVAGISHYVKNVLTGIQGSSRVVQMGLERRDIDMIEKIWPVVERSNNKIIALVHDMLNYSKEREPDWRPGNLNHLLEEVYESQASRAREAGVDLILELDEDLPDSFFDPETIHDTLLNLVGNAIEACGDRPEARVVLRSAWRADREELRLTVEDSGCGIAPDTLGHIFEPFFSTKGSKGTGLGLAVARKTAEEHGGRLSAAAEPGKGAVFTLVLPRRKA